MRRGRGFTLVELLVVIGIIALLISILLPAVSRSKKQAQMVACQANLRAMGQALTIYRNDTGHYPGHAGRFASKDSAFAVWPARLRKVMRAGRGIFWCPANDRGFQWQVVNGGPDAATDREAGYGYEKGELLLDVFSIPFSYGYNDWGTRGAGGERGLGGDLWTVKELKASRVRKADQMIAIADNTADGSWDFNIDPTNPLEFPGKIHNGGANVLFCDGHVQWYLQKEIVVAPPPSAARENIIRRMWNVDHEP